MNDQASQEQAVLDVDESPPQQEPPIFVDLFQADTTNKTLQQLTDEVDKRVALVVHLRKAAIRSTTEEDWVAMRTSDGTSLYYLEGSGAEKVANLYGIWWDKPDVEREDDCGYPAFFVSGTIHSRVLGKSIPYDGGRSGHDGFFSMRNKQRVPPEEVSVIDVRKAALTNWRGQGIATLVGLRGIPGEELTDAGLDLSKVRGFAFKDNKTGGFGQNGPSTEEHKDLLKKLGDMLMEMAGGEMTEAQNLLEKYTTFTGRDGNEVKGKRSLEDLSPAAVKVTYAKVKEDQGKKGGGAS